MNTIDRNVVITFEKNLSEEFIKLSKLIASKVNSKINLNSLNEIPHLTLYMSKYPTINEEDIFGRVEEIVKNTQPFSLIFDSKTCHSSGTIFINPQKSNDLLELHSKLVDALNPLREGLFNEDELSLPGMTEEKRRSLKEFGMWAVKGMYQPHVSIGRVVDFRDGLLALSVLPKKISYKTNIESVSVVIRGHDGTCAKILRSFSL